MNTILEIHKLADRTKDSIELLELIDENVMRCRNNGDLLGAGEWLVSKLPYVDENQVEKIFSNVIAMWASPIELKVLPSSLDDLIPKVGEFVADELAVALVAATLHMHHSNHSLPSRMNDLAFRLAQPLSNLYVEKESHKPADLCSAAARKLATLVAEFSSVIDTFVKTNCVTAKIASIEVVKKGHQLRKLILAQERPILSEIDVLLGPYFRKFCESCEKHDTKGIIKRISDLKEQAQSSLSSSGFYVNSTLWNLVVERIGQHILKLVDEASHRSVAATTPSLKLASSVFKLDLAILNREMAFSCRLINRGEGLALDVGIEYKPTGLPIELKILEPKDAFNVAGNSEQVVTFGVIIKEALNLVKIPLIWKCKILTGFNHLDEDTMTIEQQHVQPDWDSLEQNLPYSINPVKKRANLFGRDAILNKLILHAKAGTSTFLWGQKRVGKTSILQVLVDELRKKDNFVCVLLRIGEIKSLHEGQIAHVIAERISTEIPSFSMRVPNEQEFGAGASRLVPFVEKLVRTYPELKFLVIIDEFEDLDSAFYTGQRGELFVKALRSLSEIGLTFFFVGSERMNTIYNKHAVDLNKWVNVHVDCIESRKDCNDLIVKPLEGAIEYQPECVDFISEYCASNPYYIHLFCLEVFNRCWQEKRTFVSESDLYNVRDYLVQVLGVSNFSHFTDDNPVLDEAENVKQSAENRLVLLCISRLGGSYESKDDLYAVQENLGLWVSEQLSSRDITQVLDRMRTRNVITEQRGVNKYKIKLPIFKDWLNHQAELIFLPSWREYCKKRNIEDEVKDVMWLSSVSEEPFPIPEDELLAISQNLVYCGKQKDVAELRIWLNQFDDNVRIEIAFLLLKQLAENGFVTEGAKLNNLTKLEDALKDKRKQVGDGAWTIVRNRCDNLCITYVDSEMKSGSITARELAKRMRPGKTGPPNTLSDWMKSHVDKDALILLVDDFAGTGSSITKGLEKFFNQIKSKTVLETFLNEGRILCYLLYSFPEALQELKRIYQKVEFFAAHVFGDENRALDENAGIFKDEYEIDFAKDMLTQIGRELTSQYPLGYGDMGTLVAFHNTIPNNTLPIFWCSGTVNDKPWIPLFPRA